MEEGRADLVAGIAGLEEEELAELGLAQGDLDAILGPAPAAPWPHTVCAWGGLRLDSFMRAGVF